MICIEEAQRILHKHAQSRHAQLQTTTLALPEAQDFILADDIRSPAPYPYFDNSAMDGFAVRTDAVHPNTPIPISGESAAGSAIQTLNPNTAMRIFTGAPVPHTANAIIPIENCTVQNDILFIYQHPVEGQHIRSVGESIQKGEVLLTQGSLLTTENCALLSSLGITVVPVYKKLRIALGITGTELLSPTENRKEGCIYDTNGFLIRTLCKTLGMPIHYMQHIEDTWEATQTFLDTAQSYDIILTSGGISMGDTDMLARAVQQLPRSNIHFNTVSIKPGKPFTFVHLDNKRTTPLLCMPGNPLSVYITYMYFVVPYIRTASGMPHVDVFHIPVRSPCDFTAHERTRFLFVTYHNTSQNTVDVSILREQGSANIYNLAHSTGVLIVPNHTAIKKGEILSLFPFSQW